MQLFKIIIMIGFIEQYAKFDGYKSFVKTNEPLLCTDSTSVLFFCINPIPFTTYLAFIVLYFMVTSTTSGDFEETKLNILYNIKSDNDSKTTADKIYKFILLTVNAVRNYILSPLLSIASILVLSFNLSIPSMALNGLVIVFIFDLDNMIFKLKMGAGEAENEELKYDITIPKKCSKILT